VEGEPVWRLPLGDAYDKALKSKIADMRNISGVPQAGSITARNSCNVWSTRHRGRISISQALPGRTASTRSCAVVGDRLGRAHPKPADFRTL